MTEYFNQVFRFNQPPPAPPPAVMPPPIVVAKPQFVA
jgi:hypothetical protein